MSNHYDAQKIAQFRRATATMGSTEGITVPRRTCSGCKGSKAHTTRVGGSGSRLDPWRYLCDDCLKGENK